RPSPRRRASCTVRDGGRGQRPPAGTPRQPAALRATERAVSDTTNEPGVDPDRTGTDNRPHEGETSCAVGAEAPAGVPPDLLGHPRYFVLERVGCGAMGAVYRAVHLLMDRVVALKVIHPALVG